ncbi:MAG: ComEC/Rec2 family competence protein, partial [Myxococcales bacterium]
EENGLLRGLLARAERRGVRPRPLSAPFTLDGFAPVRLDVLHPASIDAATSVNDGSLVLRLQHGGISFLLTGDIERDAEATLLPALEQATVVKAPHHGSRTSSTEAFVRRVAPKHVVFCVGRRNRFGFPHEDVQERYRAAGCTLHRTDLHGAITFSTDGDELRVERTLD